jgi:hypothetical protein
LAVALLSGLRSASAAVETRITAAYGWYRAESNVIRALGPSEPKTWWGDLHGQTRATVATGTIEEYFAFGREVALLDMMCHQANDFQVTDEEWLRLRREIDRFHEDGRCVIFVGYEWSGMTPGGGDRNVMFRSDAAALHRSSHAEVDDMRDAATDCFPVTELFTQFAGRDDVMLIPHIGGRAVGTGPIERIDIFRGRDHIRMVSPYFPESFEGSPRYRIAWAGSRVRGRDRLTTWDGHVELSAGRFVNAVTFAMENPEKGIRERSARRVSWVSNTTGDDDGIDVTIDAPPDAVFRFHSPVIQLQVKVGELADGQTRRFPADGVDLRVFMRRLPVHGHTRELKFEHTDPSPMRGRCHPYWIRVTQEDGAQAWTSPVYLDV